MADVYCDQTLVSGSDNGTSWDNAYRLFSGAMGAGVLVDGDTLWVKNNASIAATIFGRGPGVYDGDSPKVIGCRSDTTNTPPVPADIIPGLRNGSSTPAYAQSGANAPPQVTITGTGNDFQFRDHLSLIYGVRFIAPDDFTFGTAKSRMTFEECYIEYGSGELGWLKIGATSVASNFEAKFKNCKFVSTFAASQINLESRLGLVIFDGCIFDINSSAGIFKVSNIDVLLDGCDFSAQSHPLVADGGGSSPGGIFKMSNCKVHASSSFVTGTMDQPFRTEFVHVSSATGKTTGQTFQEVDIITREGNVVLETSRVRTSSGADDGGTGAWALAYTPGIDDTRDNYRGLVGPKMAIEVVGDGTAQTLTVNIANSSASTDYQDDEVWLVAKSPSEAGTADYDFYTTQMDLAATPANVTDDTGSTWGSGANNHQKLEITLSPDYDGIIECWVVFAKNFGSSPETLYVDPLPVLS